MRLKLMALGLALFILSPLNILGDIPLLGIVDDVALLALLLNWFVRTAERHEASATVDGTDLMADWHHGELIVGGMPMSLASRATLAAALLDLVPSPRGAGLLAAKPARSQRERFASAA